MGYDFTIDDVDYLRSAEGIAALTRTAESELSTRTRLADIGRARARFGDRAGLLIETVLLRRKAETKLSGADSWLFTDDALQQATPLAVARHRGERLAGRRVHDVTCSIGAELSALVPVADTVVGSDLDPVRLAMAAHNVPGATLVRATRCGRARATPSSSPIRRAVPVADAHTIRRRSCRRCPTCSTSTPAGTSR